MRKFKIFTLLLIVAFILVPVLSACDPTDPTDPVDNAPIVIDKTEVTVLVGESDVIKAQTLTQGATVTWDSQNPSICVVDKGVVTGISKGQTVVSATCEGESVYCVVNVLERENPASPIGYSIRLERQSVKLAKGDEYAILAELYDTTNTKVNNPTFTYTSSASSVVTVDNNGKITAVENGTAQVVVKYTDGTNWVSAVMSITVQDVYSIEIVPYTVDPQINSQVDFSYTVYKNASVYSYPSDKVSITSSNTDVARYENGKLITGQMGIANITVTLTDVNVSAMIEVIVIDPNAPEITLSCEDIEMYVDKGVEIEVEGATWGTLVFTTSDVDFSVVNGILYSPSSPKSCTLTITHRETRQSITVNVNAIVFDPCITTAKQFMSLGNVRAGVDVYLGADIDLSNETWSEQAGLSHNNVNTVVAYLVKELDTNVDGRGHKVTVRYDYDCSDTCQIGGIFANITSNGSFKNFIVDFEAKYAGAESIDKGSEYGAPGSHPQAGMKQSVIAHNQYGVVSNNHIIARFYSDGSVKREGVIGKCGASLKNNVVDMAVYASNVLQNAGVVKWTGGNATGNVLINEGIQTDSANYKYSSFDEFYSAWSDSVNVLAIKESLIEAGWEVNADSIKYNDVLVLCEESLAAPSNVTRLNSGKVVWDAVDGATSYNLRVKWEGETNWTNLPATTSESWSITEYLKTFNSTDLVAKNGKHLTLNVQAVGDAPSSEWASAGNVFGTTNNGASNYRIRVATTLDEFKTYMNDTINLNYVVLANDLVLGNVTPETAISGVWSITGLSPARSVINGLDRKISYTYDDTDKKPASGSTFAGLFTVYSSSNASFRLFVTNLVIDANMVLSKDFDDFHAFVFANKMQAEIHESTFKLRVKTINVDKNYATRTGIVREMISNSTGSLNSFFENCLFDMVSYDKNDEVRVGGATYKDCQITRSSSNTYNYIKNCSFIMNQEQSERSWTENDANITITNSNFYKDLDAYNSAN